MRRTTLGIHLLSALTLAAPATALQAQDAQVASQTSERWSAEELDNLLAPVALYPDPILAQVLIAATYPDQVLAAQAHVRAFGSENIDAMPWEISVKAVARYEPVLNLMAEGEDWMTALGQAYAAQSADVMDAVQRLRVMANAQGNLQSTAQQQVVVEREVIRIVPAEPRVIYVPTYDPHVVYHQPVYLTHAHPAYWSWGVGYPVGVWLTYDFDWWSHRVYYHGWHSHGPRWVVFARPWIVINPIYVAPRHTVIVVNRGIAYRRWDTNRVRRYSTIHRNVGYDRHDRGFRRDVARGYNDDRGNRGSVGRGVAADTRGNGGRGVAADTRGNGGRGTAPDARGSSGARTASATRRDANGERVVPLPGAPRRDPRAGTRESVARSAERGEERGTERSAAPSRTSGETTRSSNGTWNPRPARETAVPSRSPRVDSPAPRASENGGSRVNTPRSSSQSAPRASAPRSSGASAPRASAPRSSGSSAPRASAPRSSGSSAPRASAPRSSGGGEARGSSRGSSGGSRGGGEARGSGRGRGS